MAVRAPLSVRIRAGGVDRHVTGKVSNLRFGKTAPGGFQSASMRITLDRDAFPNLSAASRLFIYGPTGKTMWEGFLDNPGMVDGAGGQAIDVSALGTSILAQDQSKALVYIDRDLGGWVPYAGSATSATATTSNDPTGGPGEGLITQFNPGQAIGTSAVAQIRYEAFNRAGWLAGAINTDARSGKIDTGYRTELAYSGPGGTFGFVTILSGTGITTVPANESRFVGASIDALSLRLKRTGGATNIADDDTWSWFTNISVVGARVDRFGTLLTGSGGLVSTTYVRADWVVEDLLGRSLAGLIDPVLSTVNAGTYQIDQLAYHDGATAGQVFDDLTLWEPTMLWEILEHTGKGYRFNYRAWPTTARYEISTRDDYTSPGGDVDLCNRVTVKWTDEKGNSRTTVVTATSAQYPALVELEKMGRVRDAETVTLPEGRGSVSNAQRIGEQVLSTKADPPKAATAVLRRRVMDNLTGRRVAPWEIEPGYMVRVRETGDLLQLTEVQYDDDEGSMALTLGRPVLTLDQRVARLDKAA